MSLVIFCLNIPHTFRGGTFRGALSQWLDLSTDSWIFNVVSGKFWDIPVAPLQARVPFPLSLSTSDRVALDAAMG